MSATLNNNNTNTVAAGVNVLSWSWMWLFVILGASQFGREKLYFPLAKHFFGTDYYQGGLVLMVLVIPILFAGTVSSLLLTAVATKDTTRKQQRQQQQQQLWRRRHLTTLSSSSFSFSSLSLSSLFSCLSCCFQRCFLSSRTSSSSLSLSSSSSSSCTATTATMFCLVIPCGVYVVTCIARKLPKVPTNNNNNDDDDPNDNKFPYLLMIIANSFAFMSLLAMSWLLIPVSRQQQQQQQGSMFMLLNANNRWLDSPIRAIQYIHMTSGYLVLIGVLVHGLLHLWRWKFMGEWWSDILVPPSSCWTWTSSSSSSSSSNEDVQINNNNNNNNNINDDLPPLCRNPDTECSCYHHFRNFTGILGGWAFLVLAITSVWPWIRRRYYAFFYMTHVIAGPLAILMTVVHYPRAILYVSPSILYYIAASFPNMMELQRQQQQKRQQKQKQRARCCCCCCCQHGSGICTGAGAGGGGVRIVSVQEFRSNHSTTSNKKNTTNKSSSTLSSSRRGGRSSSNSSIVSLHIEASPEAMRRFRPGHYIKLSCPEISWLHHPFTINRIGVQNGNGTQEQYQKNNSNNNHSSTMIKTTTTTTKNRHVLAIHFRVCGPFTTKLAERLLASSSSSSAKSTTSSSIPPSIYVNGFFGSTHRLQQQVVFQHDVVVFVAGGIGITPYLSLLQQLMMVIHNNTESHHGGGNSTDHDDDDEDDADDDEEEDDEDEVDVEQQQQQQQGQKRQLIVLHWMCREENFANYIQQEYFQPLLDYQQRHNHDDNNSNNDTSSSSSSSSSPILRIVIHLTNNDGGQLPSPDVTNLPSNETRPSSSQRSYTDVECLDSINSSNDDQNVIEMKNLHLSTTTTAASPSSPTTKHNDDDDDDDHNGVPFTPSKFAIGTTSRMRDNLVPFVTFSLIAWLGLGIIWYQYTTVIQPTAEEQVFNRIWSLVGVVVLGWIVSWLMNVWTPPTAAANAAAAAEQQQEQEQRNCRKKKRNPQQHRRHRSGGILWKRLKSHDSENGEGNDDEDNDDDDDDDDDEEERESVNGMELRPLSSIMDTEQAFQEAADAENNMSRHNHKPSNKSQTNKSSNSSSSSSNMSSSSSSTSSSLTRTRGRRPSVHDLLSALDSAQMPGLFVCGPTPLMQEIRHAVQERCLIRIRQCITRGATPPHAIALYEEAFEM